MNGYDLSRKFWDWSFENPEKVKPNHSALYFFIIEHCNRLGWKKKFGLPTTMAFEGTDRTTTDPAPTIAFFPISRFGKMVALAPIEAPSQTKVF